MSRRWSTTWTRQTNSTHTVRWRTACRVELVVNDKSSSQYSPNLPYHLQRPQSPRSCTAGRAAMPARECRRTQSREVKTEGYNRWVIDRQVKRVPQIEI